MSGGMSAVSFAGILHLLQADDTGWLHTLALSCFAIALPLLVLAFTKYKVVPRQEHIKSRVVLGSVAAGCIFAFAGLFLCIALVNYIAAGVFLVFTL